MDRAPVRAEDEIHPAGRAVAVFSARSAPSPGPDGWRLRGFRSRRAARALATFQEAAYQERVTLELLEKLSTYLNRARYNPELKFELAA